MCTESCNALNAGRTERFRHFGENTLKARTIGGIRGRHALRSSSWRYCTVDEVNASMMAKTR